jgi:anti-sigma regulatory factor (Ser/Thr protein kinase)
MTLAALSAIASRAVHRHLSAGEGTGSRPTELVPASKVSSRKRATRQVVISCVRAREQVRELRCASAAALRVWGLEPLVPDVTLLVSELVTNAVLHGHGDDLRFSLVLGDGEVRIEVEDGSPGRACVACPDPERESGRGMWLVDHFSDRWGTSEDGTSTWCTLAVPCGAAGVAG